MKALIAALLILSASPSFGAILAETETGVYFTDFDCDYDSQSIGPLDDSNLYHDYFGYLGIRFAVTVNCISFTNGRRYTLSGYDELIFFQPQYDARMRTWYAQGKPIAWYRFESNVLELNPAYKFEIWSHHMSEHLSYIIEIHN